jgi:hypothetical protein
MAKTKAELEYENSTLRQRAESAEKVLRDFQQAIPETLAEYNETYGLELCDDGTKAFLDALGIEYVEPQVPYSMNIYVSPVYGARDGGSGWNYGPNAEDARRIQDALEKAILAALKAEGVDTGDEGSSSISIDWDGY